MFQVSPLRRSQTTPTATICLSLIISINTSRPPSDQIPVVVHRPLTSLFPTRGHPTSKTIMCSVCLIWAVRKYGSRVWFTSIRMMKLMLSAQGDVVWEITKLQTFKDCHDAFWTLSALQKDRQRGVPLKLENMCERMEFTSVTLASRRVLS